MTIIRSTKLNQSSSNKPHEKAAPQTRASPNDAISPKSVVIAAKRASSQSKYNLPSLYKNLEMASQLASLTLTSSLTSSSTSSSSSCIPVNDEMIQSMQTASHRRRYMRRGSRAPSMMFHLEAAAAVSSELLEKISVPHLENCGLEASSYNMDQCVFKAGNTMNSSINRVDTFGFNPIMITEKITPTLMLTTNDQITSFSSKDQFHRYNRTPTISSILGPQFEKSISLSNSSNHHHHFDSSKSKLIGNIK